MPVSLGVPVSVDTWKSVIARRAFQNGAAIINDITAFYGDANMPQVIAEFSASVVLMFSKDRSPRTTLNAPQYDDIIRTIGDFWKNELLWRFRQELILRISFSIPEWERFFLPILLLVLRYLRDFQN